MREFRCRDDLAVSLVNLADANLHPPNSGVFVVVRTKFKRVLSRITTLSNSSDKIGLSAQPRVVPVNPSDLLAALPDLDAALSAGGSVGSAACGHNCGCLRLDGLTVDVIGTDFDVFVWVLVKLAPTEPCAFDCVGASLGAIVEFELDELSVTHFGGIASFGVR